MFEVGKNYLDKWGDKVICNTSSGECVFLCLRTNELLKTDGFGCSLVTGDLLIVGPWPEIEKQKRGGNLLRWN